MSQRVITKKLQWLGDEGHNSFAVTYALDGISNTTDKRIGVIVIPPFGHEYNHSHRALAYLSEQLCISNRGPVLKLELPGVGNANGDVIAGEVGQLWVDAFNAAVLMLQREYHTTEVRIVGYRMGALVAAYLAQKDTRVRGLVFWNPYLTGAPFFRDMEMLQSMQAGSTLQAAENFDAGGCCFDLQSRVFIESLNLKLVGISHVDSVDFIQPKELPLSKRLVNQLQEQGLNVSVSKYDENRDFQKPALENKVPRGAILAILQALNAGAVEMDRTDYALRLSAAVSGSELVCEGAENGVATREQIIVCESTGMAGVLTQNSDHNNRKLLVLINGGAAHHVGPARLHVNLARALATQDYAVLRIDLSHLGEGAKLTTLLDEGINPFPAEYSADIKALLDLMQVSFGYSEIALGGLCSAGHNSFNFQRTQLDTRVQSVLLINPIHLYWQPGTAYMASASAQNSIGAALSGLKACSKVGLESKNSIDTLRCLMQGSMKLFVAVLLRGNSVLSLIKTVPSNLSKDIATLNRANVNVNLLVSKNEQGRVLFKNRLGVRYWLYLLSGKLNVWVLGETDHAFSTRPAQKMLIDKIKSLDDKLLFGDAK